MQFYIRNQNRQLELQTAPSVELTDENMVKVRVEKSLISYGDLRSFSLEQHADVIPGRYAVGSVSETLDPDASYQKGQRVVISSFVACGNCYSCKTNHTNNCSSVKEMGVDIDGVYRDFMQVPSGNLFTLPDIVTFEEALFTEHIALALNVIDKLNIERGEHVAIMSDSKLGLILGQLSIYYGAIPILIHDSESTTELAKQLGIFYTVSHKDSDSIIKDVFLTTGGRMCEKVIYIKDSDLSLSDLDKLCAFGARVCVMLNNRQMDRLNVEQLIKKQLQINGLSSPLGNFPSAINLLATKKINVSALMGDHITFEKLGETMSSISLAELATKSIIVDY